MKRNYMIYTIILMMLGLLSGCSATKDTGNEQNAKGTATPTEQAISPSPTSTVAPTQVATNTGTVETFKLHSKSIENNLVGNNPDRDVYVYLPPSYSQGDKRYPVVYFLHGYGDNAQAFMIIYKKQLNDCFTTDSSKEFILVVIDGNNGSRGSFYVNSEVGGNWEDYITTELVGAIDQKYRTLTDSNSRGIAGYSMGGFGALYISLRHPDLFSSTLVFCPGIFAPDNLNKVMSSWSSSIDIKTSYAQAFSPNKEDTKNFGNLLTDKDIKEKNAVWKDWMNGFSNWDTKLDDYMKMDAKLQAISINYSEDDSYSWIPGGCKYLAGLLKDRNIPFSFSEFSGGHIVPKDAIENYFVPFFGENFVMQ